MERMNTTATESDPLTPAATIIVLRPAPSGFEVLLLRRHSRSSVLAGAYVFPGGKLDAADAQLTTHLDQTPSALHAALGEPELDPTSAAAMFVAAAREAFEESGLLYAEEAGTEALAEATRRLRAGESFSAVLAALRLRLATRALTPFSRWITPRSAGHKRFDTRFFVATAPAGQEALHDNYEATESVWLTPRAALEQYMDDRLVFAPPQVMTMAQLARHQSIDDVLARAAGRLPPLIRPHSFEHEGERALCYPGDALHPVRDQLIPGPTRMIYRDQRFQPFNGLAGFFE